VRAIYRVGAVYTIHKTQRCLQLAASSEQKMEMNNDPMVAELQDHDARIGFKKWRKLETALGASQ